MVVRETQALRQGKFAENQCYLEKQSRYEGLGRWKVYKMAHAAKAERLSSARIEFSKLLMNKY